jgi:hypothetical protein
MEGGVAGRECEWLSSICGIAASLLGTIGSIPGKPTEKRKKEMGRTSGGTSQRPSRVGHFC